MSASSFAGSSIVIMCPAVAYVYTSMVRSPLAVPTVIPDGDVATPASPIADRSAGASASVGTTRSRAPLVRKAGTSRKLSTNASASALFVCQSNVTPAASFPGSRGEYGTKYACPAGSGPSAETMASSEGTVSSGGLHLKPSARCEAASSGIDPSGTPRRASARSGRMWASEACASSAFSYSVVNAKS